MIEIRIHGRGGQGAVTTSQLLAISAFLDGKQSQGFPHFGVERSGAPVKAYARIDDKKINLRSQIYEPDVVLVLDASLLHTEDVTVGLKKKGICIINSKKNAEELGIKDGFEVFTVDATGKALEIFGKPIINTAILGAFSAATGLVSLDSLYKAIDQRFGEGPIADKNKQIIKEVHEMVKK